MSASPASMDDMSYLSAIRSCAEGREQSQGIRLFLGPKTVQQGL